MDVDALRTVMTVVTVIAFAGIVVWAFSRKRKGHFDEAGKLPFSEKESGEDTAADDERERRR
jgi:cytochrome c oxidase cbb3-type subunit 4